LRTKAVLKRDDYHQWTQDLTSMAFDATHYVALVRTTKPPEAGGITFVSSKWITGSSTRDPRHRGIGRILRVSSDVHANMRDVVGGLNGGWNIAKTLLGFERVWPIATPVANCIGMVEACEQMGIFDDRFQENSFSSRLMCPI